MKKYQVSTGFGTATVAASSPRVAVNRALRSLWGIIPRGKPSGWVDGQLRVDEVRHIRIERIA